jgi:hypothetical protein
MREFCRRHLLYSPHGLSDHRSEAFRQKMIHYFQYDSGSNGRKPWNGIKSIPHGNENAKHLLSLEKSP